VAVNGGGGGVTFLGIQMRLFRQITENGGGILGPPSPILKNRCSKT